MVALLTKDEHLKALHGDIGTAPNTDGWYGSQCFDEANQGWYRLYKEYLKGQGAKDIPFKNDFKGKAVVHQNTPDFLAEPGDLVVWGANYGAGFGHVGWVVEADLNQLTVIEQNWLGGGWTDGINQPGSGWEKVTKRVHPYDFPMWFIRPIYKEDKPKAKATSAVTKANAKKATPAPKRKAPKLNYFTDHVNGYNLPKRGYKPAGIVLHNDAGSAGATAKAYRNSLGNAPLSRLEAGIAHSYISGTDVWQALDESQIGWHTATANGNKNYYGIEVCQSVGATNAQFLANEQAAFQESARLLKKWGLPANRNTVMLHCEFISTACPHRSAYLHTGFNPTTQGALPQEKILQLKDYFIKQIRAYMNGDVPVSTVSKQSPASSNTVKPVGGAWRKNAYGTYYMAESATFVCGNTPIATHVGAPFRTVKLGYWFQPGGWVDYDEVCLQDGHVWIGYNWQGQRYYLPIRTWNGVAPPNQKVGDLWGSIK